MKIAILGTRGIPARYGGFETFAEELSTRLVKCGHEVTVFCRRPFFQKSNQSERFEGVQLVYCPTIMHKYLETPLHALTSLLWLLFHRHDVALLCNAANSPFAWLARIVAIPICINVDGIERMRGKWNALGKVWYLIGERCAVWFSNKVIADADVIADYYREEYNCEPVTIAYGAEAKKFAPGEAMAKFGLARDNYILYVSRLEPENNALGVVQAYGRLKTDVPLVIVGDAPYAKEYIEQVKNAANENVIFTGYQFGNAYHELQSNCLCYVQATEVGGTHPALIEAMAHGNAIIANGTPENREVLDDAGLFYERNDFQQLAAQLERLLKDSELRQRLRQQSAQRAARVYSWEAVTGSYQKLFESMTGVKNNNFNDLAA